MHTVSEISISLLQSLCIGALSLVWISSPAYCQQNSSSPTSSPADIALPTPRLLVKTPAISSDVRLNPGKGWVLYGDVAAYSPKLLALGTVNYERTEWGSLEPKPGVFRWEFVDDRIRRCALLGKSFAFGVMCANVSSNQEYPTPKWVFDEGAESRTSKSPVTGVMQVIPKWDDPIFLRELGKFAQALGKRYDGNRHIAFIDIRSYGNWGEGHLYLIGGTRISNDALKQHIMAYKDAFAHTRLVLPWGEHAFDSVYQWAVDQGISLRRDGICGNSDGSEMLPCLGKVPAIFEFFASYESMKKNGWWDGRQDAGGNGHSLTECVSNGHPSYISLDGSPESAAVFMREQAPLIRQLANSMGYDFAIRRAAFPNIWRSGTADHLDLTVENIGVAPLYEPATLAVALLDEAAHVVERVWIKPSDVDPHRWQPGKPASEAVSVTFSKAPPGSYRLALGMFTSENLSGSAYLFANEGSTPGRWLVLDRVWVVKP
jgi:hypothetical protein